MRPAHVLQPDGAASAMSFQANAFIGFAACARVLGPDGTRRPEPGMASKSAAYELGQVARPTRQESRPLAFHKCPSGIHVSREFDAAGVSISQAPAGSMGWPRSRREVVFRLVDAERVPGLPDGPPGKLAVIQFNATSRDTDGAPGIADDAAARIVKHTDGLGPGLRPWRRGTGDPGHGILAWQAAHPQTREDGRCDAA